MLLKITLILSYDNNKMTEIDEVNYFNNKKMNSIFENAGLEGGKRVFKPVQKNIISETVNKLILNLKEVISNYKIFLNYFFIKTIDIKDPKDPKGPPLATVRRYSINNRDIKEVFSSFNLLIRSITKVFTKIKIITNNLNLISSKEIKKILDAIIPFEGREIFENLIIILINRSNLNDLNDPIRSSQFVIVPDSNLIKVTEAHFLTNEIINLFKNELTPINLKLAEFFNLLRVQQSRIGI